MTRAHRHSSFGYQILLLLCCCVWIVQAWGRKSRGVEESAPSNVNGGFQDDEADKLAAVPYLVHQLGHQFYIALFTKRSTRLYIYMIYGSIPNEESVVVMLNTICNLMYCTTVLTSFLVFPRGIVLFATICTIFVGPALALIVLGAFALVIGAFALYPLASVLTMWLIFFLTSQCAQVIGKRLGLDVDDDGDVNVLDLLHYLSNRPFGRAIGLPRLYSILKESSLNPFDQINRRLDDLQRSTRSLGENINNLAQEDVVSQRRSKHE